jgi:hypothetical protein
MQNPQRDTSAPADSPFQPPIRKEFASTETVQARNETAASAVAAQARAMVESRYVMALRKPRNWDQVRLDIIKECRRPSFAHNKSALYNKPIGKGVEGLGIRFVEVALRCMTNVLCESVMVYADEEREIHRVSVTDLENNNTWPMDVTVSKTVERQKPSDDGSYISVRKNSYGKLTYTVPATDDDLLNKRLALISKALRTAGLRVIPGDLQDEAEEIIRAIRLDAAAKDPDAERKKISDAFATLGVKATDLHEYLGHPLDGCTPTELVDLRGLYGALKDGEATWKTVMENKQAQAGGATPADPITKTGAAGLKAAVAAGAEKSKGAEEKTPPAGDPKPAVDDGMAPTLATITAMVDKARTTKDAQTALLKLEDAENIASGLPKADAETAKKAIEAARAEIDGRTAPKK